MSASSSWSEANQRYLVASVGRVRDAVTQHLRPRDGATFAPATTDEPADLGDGSGQPPALEMVRDAFALSSFETDVLLLCAGVELDAGFAELFASDKRSGPTFGLALAALAGAHWTALLPDAPLRRHRLVELGGDSLTRSPLRIDERVLHYLVGVNSLDERLRTLVAPAPLDIAVPASHALLAQRIARRWDEADPPLVHLVGADPASRRAVAAAAATAAGAPLHVISAQDLPSASAERDAFERLWERESRLTGAALLVTFDDASAPDAALAIVEPLAGRVIASSRVVLRPRRRLLAHFEVNRPVASERRAMWDASLGELAGALGRQVDRVTSHFDLDLTAIRAAAAEVLALVVPERAAVAGAAELEQRLWDACRVHARPRLDDLATRIEGGAGWEDLVLPAVSRDQLRAIASHVRQRDVVLERWGFAERGRRGLGLAVLFAGASGTGKTMAAEALATELQLDLYRIDLSQVVSKYIGETEKNLRRVFDAAEEGGAILLFDEADALFGKRSEVKDSHDRYANIEVSYLLQRMESYRGLAILTSNLRSAVDTAFLRRLRFVVEFPFPDDAQRAEIWRRIFPRQTPTDGLEPEVLARLDLSGGNIRNIALGAAFLAADAGEPVRMTHVLVAAKSEYDKLEKPMIGFG